MSILPTLFTTADRARLIEQLASCTNSLYSVKTPLAKRLELLPKEISESLNSESSIAQVKETLQIVEKDLEAAPIVTVTLAFSPSERFLQTLGAEIKAIVSPNALLDISIDPALLGGMQISYKGKYVDLSVRQKLDKTTSLQSTDYGLQQTAVDGSQ